MPFSINKSWVRPTLLIIGVFYPVLIYFGLSVLNPGAVVALVLLYLTLRSIGSGGEHRVFDIAFKAIALVTAVLVIAVFMVDPEIAVKIYPISVSVGFAVFFSHSLINPPSVIERFARIKQPDLSEKGVTYTRRVTIIWIIFFIVNALISGWTALFEGREVWLLYNGLISYALIGTLIVGELVLRKIFKAGQP